MSCNPNNNNVHKKQFKSRDEFKNWIINKIDKIKKSIEDKSHSEFLNDDFIEIYEYLIRLVNMCANKNLRESLKRELANIKKCCDADCKCIHRSKRFLKIYDDLIIVINKSIISRTSVKKQVEVKVNPDKANEKKNFEKKDVSKKDDTLSEKKVQIKKVSTEKELKKKKDPDEEKYENKVYDNGYFKLELDNGKDMKVEADYGFDRSTLNDKKYNPYLIENDKDEENLGLDEEADLINAFAYIYNLGKLSLKPGESASFDQVPIINSVPDAVVFKEPSSIIINEGGLYNILYFAQTEEKNITLALFINDTEIEETSASTTSYSDTISSQGLILVPDDETPICITLRNADDENYAVFNRSVKSGEVNLSILIRKIS
ncbi:MAG: hypothetical protein FWC47_11730 [Oscillospiraceae bacterium]|nr:hypothetical protein [Oscillospiraceae bacterium]